MDQLSNTTGRQSVPDYLKCLCCFCVIMIHTASQSMTYLDVHSFNWYCATIYGCLVRFAVPVFFMVTGTLLLDPARAMTVKRTFTHYFLRVLLCLLFWAFAYQLFFIIGKWILYRQFDPNAFKDAIVSVLTFNHHFHLYYLQILLVFYLLLPALRVFTANASKTVYLYTLVFWAVFGVVFPFLTKSSLIDNLTGIPAEYPLPMTYSSIGYCLLGYYLKTLDITRKQLPLYLLMYVVGFGFVFGLTAYFSEQSGSLCDTYIYAFSPAVTLMAIGVYGTVSAFAESHESGKIVRWLAGGSFCVFLVHHFFVMLLRTYLYFAFKYYCFIVIPAQALVVYLGSLAVYAVLKKIPWVRNHLI